MQYHGMRGETNEGMNSIVEEDRMKTPLVCCCSTAIHEITDV